MCLIFIQLSNKSLSAYSVLSAVVAGKSIPLLFLVLSCWKMVDSQQLVKKDFEIADYVIFVVSLVIPVAVGVYYGFAGKKRSSREILLGSSRLGIFPVAMALIATYMSAVSVMGYPSEIYHFGGMMLYYLVAYLFVFPLVAYVFLPVMHPLKLTSVYEVEPNREFFPPLQVILYF
ncbi:hypothetical protein D918_02856 [Trichuris suis]|nr:hypothetical protein D918_02856 [Trichuris suis]